VSEIIQKQTCKVNRVQTRAGTAQVVAAATPTDAAAVLSFGSPAPLPRNASKKSIMTPNTERQHQSPCSDNTMHATRITVALAGLGGYGEFYLDYLLGPDNTAFALVGGVDPQPQRCARLTELRAAQVPVVASLEELYAAQRPDLLILCTPLQWHVAHTCLGLRHGSHVLCEKPLCAVVQDVPPLLQARAAAGTTVAIGYQWSFSPAIHALKRDIMAGVFGAPVRLRTITRWPRSQRYYDRNRWAGAYRDTHDRWVLDSPVNNATAHYLHNMLYVLGAAGDRSAAPHWLEGELYRANPIGNFDTAALRCLTATGVEVLFYTTHAARTLRGPDFLYEFEQADVTYRAGAKNIVATFRNGRTHCYGNPDAENHRKLTLMADAVRHGTPPLCGVEAALSHTLCVNGLQDSVPDIPAFPPALVRCERDADDQRICVEGLDEIYDASYAAGVLPSEQGVAWAHKGRRIMLDDYTRFPIA